ncbi:glycosyltransferase family 2 protein [Cyclobacterium jeungdonense]|uniref:Glycosyltransferase family 2 protein n=1 Tax=Cyclobacterium jeungdonense TaxID=708087 RepID=A0ABT8CF94_9BACT|nr:glycosyltransferase family 2 protein [Cyclobacterium jeungdonense]MDN3690732.1 glycosyltransferase family 2 protein [Cyclobacterium jeungdonense]
MDKPLISVITINYNGLTHTLAFLASFQKVTYTRVEIIVVDNASKEDPGEILVRYPNTILVRNPLNEGFAGGNNRGMEAASGDYFFFVNNDTEVAENILDVLLDRSLTNPTIGLVCPKILYYDQPDTIQFAGFSAINPITGRGKGKGYLEKDRGQYQKAEITQLAHGAAMFIPKTVVLKIGMMAELYFLYYEEMDYCERIKDAGYTLWYEPQTYILHKESMSVGKNSLLKTYYMSRNRWLFLRRNVTWPLFFFTALYYLAIALPKNLIVYLIHSEWAHAKTYFKGFGAGLFMQNINDNLNLIQNEDRH